MRLSTIQLFVIKHNESTYNRFISKKKQLNTFAFWFVPEKLNWNPQLTKQNSFVRKRTQNLTKVLRLTITDCNNTQHESNYSGKTMNKFALWFGSWKTIKFHKSSTYFWGLQEKLTGKLI